MPDILIDRILPDEAAHLIAALDAYQEKLYPPESNHLKSIDALSRPNVMMYGCRIDGELAAIGAVKMMNGYGEVKRVFVPEMHRGKGLAVAIMDRLEHSMGENGLEYARLETGIHQGEAIGLYAKLGYLRRNPFGEYLEDPLSVFMEKRL